MLRNEQLRKPQDKKIVPAKQRGIWRTNAHAEQERFKLENIMDTLKSRNPITVLTQTGKVQINEKARVFVHDFDLFVTVRFLDETPAVLSLGMLCSKHGYSYAWKNGETPRLANYRKSTTCTVDNFVPLVVAGLSSYSSSSLYSTSRSTDQ